MAKLIAPTPKLNRSETKIFLTRIEEQKSRVITKDEMDKKN